MADDPATGTGPQEELLRQFLRDGRLTRLPARSGRRQELLRYLAMRDFRPRTWYSEREVNEILKAWCEGAVLTDYVSVRRDLVDYRILDRDEGKYWCTCP